ncbi:MAG TPA: hypothetical protein VFP68_10355 [Burkholderiaceae bacterium]|nr:hypothetical protein [Burkholderiaceae bacterium]
MKPSGLGVFQRKKPSSGESQPAPQRQAQTQSGLTSRQASSTAASLPPRKGAPLPTPAFNTRSTGSLPNPMKSVAALFKRGDKEVTKSDAESSMNKVWDAIDRLPKANRAPLAETMLLVKKAHNRSLPPAEVKALSRQVMAMVNDLKAGDSSVWTRMDALKKDLTKKVEVLGERQPPVQVPPGGWKHMKPRERNGAQKPPMKSTGNYDADRILVEHQVAQEEAQAARYHGMSFQRSEKERNAYIEERLRHLQRN